MSAIEWVYPSRDGRIDAVIVDWNTPGLAARCLESLIDCPMFASVGMVDAKALGWSYARSVNTVLNAGRGDVVLALNADTRMLEPPDGILSLFDGDPRVGIVGPRQVTSDGRIVHGGIFGTNDRPEFRCWQTPLAAADAATSDTRDAVTVSGSVFFARRACWTDIGGFLEVPRMYYEETFAAYNARHRGWRVLYTGVSTWLHEWNSSPLPAAEKAQMAAESRAIFRHACAQEGIDCD